MKRMSLLLIGVCVLGGCGANAIIQGGTSPQGKALIGLLPSERLVERGKISQHRVFERPDGVEIDTWVLQHTTEGDAVATAVVLHGFGQSKWEYLGVGEELAKLGYDVVLPDLRTHGMSTGEYITCGAKEKQDVKAIVDALAAEGVIAAKPIYVYGATFGGATAIQYAAIEPKVAGVVAIAPWASTVVKAKRDLGLAVAGNPEKLDEELEEAGEMADFDPFTTSAVADAATLKIPVYLVHGMFDLVVPLADSQMIYNALAGPKGLKVVSPGPEQSVIGLTWDTWSAQQVDNIRTGKMPTGVSGWPAKETPAETPEEPKPNGDS